MAILAGMLVLYFVWGSTYIAIRLAVETIPPFLMAGSRFLVAGLILLGWEWIAVRRIRSDPNVGPADRPGRPTRRQLRDSAIVGGLLLGGGMGLVALGERTVPAGITAFLIAMLPVWVAVFGRAFFGERLPRAVLAGVIVGIVGVAILVGPVGTSGGGLAFDPLGLAVLIASPMCWATGSLYSSQRAVLPPRPLTATGFQMLFGSAILLVAAVLTGELRGFDPSAISGRSAAGLLYLIVFGSLLAFTTFVWLLRVAPLPKVATYAYINPIVAIVLAGLVLGEPIEPRTAIAGAVIVAGVALIVTARGRSQAVESVMPTPSLEAAPASPAGVLESQAGATAGLPERGPELNPR
jgi:drug/metabolite transporter (DMT)-like permease